MSVSRNIYNVRKMAAQIVAAVACAYVVFVTFTYIPYFIDNISPSDTFIAPRLLQVIVLLAALVALTHPEKIVPFLKSPVAIMSVGIACVYAYNLIRLPYLVDNIDWLVQDATVNRLERFIIFPSAAFIFYVVRFTTIERMMIFAVVLVPVPVILDFFMPDLFASASAQGYTGDRAVGTYGNANQASEAILLWLIVVQNRVKGWFLVTLYLLSATAILLTFSRSGMLGLLVLGAYLIYRGKLPKTTLIAPVFVIVFSTTLLNYAEEMISLVVENEAVVEDLVNRLNFLGDEDGLDDNSSVSRQEVVIDAIQAIKAKPISGYAIEPEFSLFIPTHNFFLENWYIYGILGVVIFFWILRNLHLAGLERGWGWVNPGVLMYLLFTPFDHQHTTALYWLIFYAYAMKPLSSDLLADSSFYSGGTILRRKKPQRRKRRKRRSASAT